MFSIILRRLQKYLWAIKIFFIIPLTYGLYYLIFNTPPQMTNIVLATFLLWLEVMFILSFFLQTKIVVLMTTLAVFTLFLKAVDLLTWLNLGLLGIFIFLLALYLFQPGQKKIPQRENSPAHFPTRPLFPKGWLKEIGKKEK